MGARAKVREITREGGPDSVLDVRRDKRGECYDIALRDGECALQVINVDPGDRHMVAYLANGELDDVPDPRRSRM
jgi:hypothetical protein